MAHLNWTWIGLASISVLMLPVLILLWPLTLIALVIGLCRWSQHHQGVLAAEISRWNQRHSGAVVCVQERHGLIAQLMLNPAEESAQTVLCLQVKLLEQSSNLFELTGHTIALGPWTPTASPFRSQLRGLMKTADVALVNEIAVEAQALRNLSQWLEEIAWSDQAIETLKRMDREAEDAIRVAFGNPLLEDSIPQLQQAQQRYRSESEELKAAATEARTMARHLGDFLCIPASARRIIQFDPVQISNRSRFQQLRQSFNDVVLLNQCFRDLSAQKLA